MKKLNLLMVCVLLFSMNVLAQDLTKEEIINEFKKIVTIADDYMRLEKYDLLAKKLGLNILGEKTEAKEPIINEYSGNGMQTTRPFTVNSAWEIQWDTKEEGFMAFSIILYEGSGSLVNVVANQSEPGKGSYYSPKGGEYYLAINAVANWEIKIVEVK